MKQSDVLMGEVLKAKLQQYSTTVSFDSVWDKHERESKKYFGSKKTMLIPIVILLTLFTVGFASYGIIRTVDNTGYSFVDDQRVIGKWESVDFVDEIEKFEPDKNIYSDELYLTALVFIDGGDTLISYEGSNLLNGSPIWTKGLILDKEEETASKYEVKAINGETYMFVEWKSGDYTFRGMKPAYYVLKKADSKEYSKVEEFRIEENIDYPFISDPKAMGKWQSVDFVEKIDDFDPGVKSFLGDSYLTEFNILEDGKLDVGIVSGNAAKHGLTWTKDMILNKQDKTASKYEIKEIGGETYMFFEWKSGNYTIRGMKPKYYVLKKAE